MPRTSSRPFAAVGLVAALLVYVGCSSSRNDDAAASSTGQTHAPVPGPVVASRPISAVFSTLSAVAVAASAAPDPAPPTQTKAGAVPSKPAGRDKGPFADWPAPNGVLVISGEQFGYLEPCGCTGGQLGGLLRRYELVARLTGEKTWPVALVDLGGLIKDPASARGGPEQIKIKFHVALNALSAMKYDALALNPEDLKVGVDEAVGEFLNLQSDRPKIVAANIAVAGLETRVVPSVRAKLGPVTVGITAVVKPETIQALRDPALESLTVKPIDAALPAVLADLEKTSQTQVLLANVPPDEARAIAKKYPGFDVVVASSTLPDPPQDAERLNGGKTLLVNVGQKGKYVGVVGVFPDPAHPYRYQRVSLDERYNGPATPVKKIIEDEYREALKSQRVVENFPRHGFINGARGARFIGAEACKTCHPNTYSFWASTKHAQAFESLVKDPKPLVIHDAECVSCHTTGFEFNTGYKSPGLTAYLKGNQCENCHGPGSTHAAAPDDKAARAFLHLTAEQADRNRLCLRCHDEDNSPHFTFDGYWGKVAHKGLDTYKDPRVHQGAAGASRGLNAQDRTKGGR